MDTLLLEQILFWILVPIIVIILIIVLIAMIRMAFVSDKPKITQELDINSLRTGDILGVGYTHPFGWFVTAWSCSIWSHTGIVWIDPDNGEIFVLEAAIYHGIFQGVIKIPLVTWLRINRNFNLGIARLRGKTVDPTALIQAFESRKKYVQLESYNWRWYRLLRTSPYFEDDRKEYTCYELVTTLLQDVGVIVKKKACSSYFPKQIMKGEVELCKDYILEPAVMLDVTKHTQLREAEDTALKKKRRNILQRMFTSWGA
jgi:hypothetical protein